MSLSNDVATFRLDHLDSNCGGQMPFEAYTRHDIDLVARRNKVDKFVGQSKRRAGTKRRENV